MIIYSLAKGFSGTRDGSQIISVTRDRAQISRVTRGWAYQRDPSLTIITTRDAWFSFEISVMELQTETSTYILMTPTSCPFFSFVDV